VKTWRLLIAGVAAVGAGVTVFLLLFIGPRMYDQPHIRAFQAEFPKMPAGVVPLSNPVFPMPTAAEAKAMKNPLPDTEANRARGKTYYDYYCVSCHGDKGDGNGPVGESYVPVPTDLRAAKVQAYADGPLLRAMLAGTGHEPVLSQVIHPEHSWYLVLYVRSLTKP
jgi:hypothetical protein